MKRVFFLSCEHGGNEVPDLFKPWFKGASKVLASHRGWDIGALDLFAHLKPLADASYSNKLSRLCIEFNRSEEHPQLFSEYTRELPSHLRSLLMDIYLYYRAAMRLEMDDVIARKSKVLHISVHSFTPELDGKVRTADVGLLFDPARKHEKELCERWRVEILRRAPGLRVRMNYPYKGSSDGLPTALRKRYGKGDYSGIELEVNQKFAPKGVMSADIRNVLHASLGALLRA